MNLIKINGELLYCADEVSPGSVVQFTRVGEREGIPVVEVVELMPAEYMPSFSFGPGNTGSRGRDPELDGEKWNQIMDDQHQVQSRPLVGRIPSDSTDDDALLASTRTAQSRGAENALYDPEDIEFPDHFILPGQDAEIPWLEAEVEECREVGGLLVLKLDGKTYLVAYDDEPRRSGMGEGARIRYRVMPQRSTSVPGVGRMDVDEIQLGNVLIPAGPGYSGTKKVL